MRILQICNKPPYPPADGGSLAMYNMCEGLIANGAQVTVLAINTPKHKCDVNKLPVEFLENKIFKTIFVDTQINFFNALNNLLFGSTPYNIERFYSKDVENLIIKTLSSNNFDVIQLESLFVSPYLETIKKYSNTKIIMRSHNIEHILWGRRAKEEKNIFKKLYLRTLYKRIKKYELKISDMCDGIVAITQKDADFFKHAVPNTLTISIPFGLDAKNYNPSTEEKENSDLFFIGSLDWEPNLSGLRWFLKNVWKHLSADNKKIKFHIAGKNTPLEIEQYANENTIIHGEVADAIDYMNKHDIMVVPLFSGGGMRIKVIEGMALGKTIITTSIGAEGISCVNEDNVLISNTANEFRKYIEQCINEPVYRKKIGERAKKIISNEYDINALSKNIMAFYNQLISSQK